MNNNAEKQYELNKELAQMLKGCLLYTSAADSESSHNDKRSSYESSVIK